MEELISYDPSIKINKKDEKIMLQSIFTIKNTNKLIEIINNFKIFKKFAECDRETINSFYERDNKIMYVFNNPVDDGSNELEYLCFQHELIKKDNIYIINTHNIDKFINLINVEPLDIYDFKINIQIENNDIGFMIKYKYHKNKVPNFIVKKISKTISKMMYKFINYLKEL